MMTDQSVCSDSDPNLYPDPSLEMQDETSSQVMKGHQPQIPQ